MRREEGRRRRREEGRAVCLCLSVSVCVCLCCVSVWPGLCLPCVYLSLSLPISALSAPCLCLRASWFVVAAPLPANNNKWSSCEGNNSDSQRGQTSRERDSTPWPLASTCRYILYIPTLPPTCLLYTHPFSPVILDWRHTHTHAGTQLPATCWPRDRSKSL
ncbi:hypothetical protein DFP73DRAFT_40623 [Morchella snyderi]|nr:hypothetical protein DFP73DRAFT_40623 [Morchella snyderi]